KFDSRLLGSLPTAVALIVVAIVGAVINAKINNTQVELQTQISDSQTQIQKEIARAQQLSDSFALYTSRETARNSLRADVFGVLAQHVVTELKSEDFKKVALLAAYHGSFSKHIDTRPVFEAFLKEVHDPDARHELRRLATRVARRQANYIAAHGGVRDRQKVHWRAGSDNAECVFNLRGHEMKVLILEVDDTGDDGKERPVHDVANTVEIELYVDEEKRSFSISYLDAPYIDNIFLVHSDEEIHRIALLLLDITKTDDDDYDLTLEALHFPPESILPGDVPSAQKIQKAHKAKILPGDVPSAQEIQKPVDESDSHEAKEHHDAESS
ncbi:MAG: hypothetical protein O7D91_18535, partial [Planctomycetota bacterium]|nr:hypothetical protein [Planctomycetota bacterium]